MTKALLVNTATDLAGGDNGKGDTIAAGPNQTRAGGGWTSGRTLDATAREFYDQAGTCSTRPGRPSTAPFDGPGPDASRSR